jgi:hypothetical protein
MAEAKSDDLIACCGLDCGKCFGYTKTVSEAARQLRNPFLGDYDAFKKHLDALAGLRCKCCLKRGYGSCAECDEFERCEKLAFLEPGHRNVHLKKLRKIKSLVT